MLYYEIIIKKKYLKMIDQGGEGGDGDKARGGELKEKVCEGEG